MIDYYCEMHGCKFIPLVSSIFVRARRCSYKCAPVYLGIPQFLILPVFRNLFPKSTSLQEHDYVGMFEYKSDQLQQVLKALIYDLKAKTAAQMLPGLPAYILFMMIRSVGRVDFEYEN